MFFADNAFSANQPVTATCLGVMAEKPEHGGATVMSRGAKVWCTIGHLHILFNALHETPRAPFNLSIYTFFSLLLAAVRDVYNSLNELPVFWITRGRKKQPSNNIKRTHLLHLVFVVGPQVELVGVELYLSMSSVFAGAKEKKIPLKSGN